MRKLVYTVLSVPVFGMLYLFTALMVVLILPLAYAGWKKAVVGLMRLWAGGMFLLCAKRLQIRGRENIEPGKRYLVLVNHSSLFDIPAVMTLFPGVSWLGRAYLLDIPLLGRILRMTNYVSLNSTALRDLRPMLRKLEANARRFTLAIFPEGTRTTDGRLRAFKRGFMYLLKSTEMDILPVTLSGFFRFKPKTRWTIQFNSPLKMTVHPPITCAQVQQMPESEILKKVRQAIETDHYA